MWRYPPLILALFLLTAGLAASAPAHPDATRIRQTIQRELDRMDAAFARKDLAGAYAFYAPDYRRTDTSGKSFDLASDRHGATQLFPAMRFVRGMNRIQTIAVADSRATVTVLTHGHIVIQPVGSKHQIVGDDTETRRQIWVASGPSWLMQQSRTLSSRQTVHDGVKTMVIVNGKPQK